MDEEIRLDIEAFSWHRSHGETSWGKVWRNRGLRTDTGSVAGVVMARVNGRLECVLYSGVAPGTAGADVDWYEIAIRTLEAVGGYGWNAPALARFLAANAGALPYQRDLGAWSTDHLRKRLAEGAWSAPLFDIATGKIVRDLRAFLPVRRCQADKLTLDTRISMGGEICEAMEELQYDLAEQCAPHDDAGVPRPLIRLEQDRLITDRVLTLETIFRIEAAVGDPDHWLFGETEPAFQLAGFNNRGEYYREILAAVDALRTAFAARKPARQPASVTIRHFSPLYGGTTIPSGAGLAGVDLKELQRHFRARLDDRDAESIEDKRGHRMKISTRLFAWELIDLGLIEKPADLTSDPWTHFTPSLTGRRLARLAGGRYTRATALKALDGLLQRAAEINADPSSIYKIEKLVLFGSLAKGADRVGDIDIGVVSRHFTDDKDVFSARWQEIVDEEGETRNFRDFFEEHAWPSTQWERRLRGPGGLIRMTPWGNVRKEIQASTHVVIFTDTDGATSAFGRLLDREAKAA